jgi:NADH-quinone oxidoreductase subunit E
MNEDVKEIDIVTAIDKAIEKHGSGRDAIIPILSEVNWIFGYIPPDTLPEIRRRINSPDEGLFLGDSSIYSVASFYHMFSLKPLGRHVVRFCESAPCHVQGGRLVIKTLQNELGIQPGETTTDKKWSLIMTSCLGICGVGPVFMVDDNVYGNVTPERVHEILADYD